MVINDPAMKVRLATIADIPSIAQINVDMWRHTYKGILSDDYLASLNVSKRIEKMTLFCEEGEKEKGQILVAESESKIVGFAICGKVRDALGPIKGELYAIYVLPEFQGAGVGALLFRTSSAFLQEKQLLPMVIWVLKDNSAAGMFYERMGAVRSFEKIVTIGTQQLSELGYTWTSS